MNNWRRPLIIAFLVSIVFHVMLIASFQMRSPEADKTPLRILQARLVPMQPVAPIAESVTPPAQIAQPKKPKRRPQARPAEPAPAMDSAAPPAPETPPIAEEAQVEALPVPQQPAVAEPPNEEATSAEAQTTLLPNQLLIRFTVNWGANGLGVGRAEYRWQRDGTRYSLHSSTESTGIVELFKSMRLSQTSEGEITENGLRPDTFVMQRTAKPTQSAAFDWLEQSLKLTDGDQSQRFSLRPGTQDLLSVLFQFAFVPPSGDELELAVVTGRKLDTYRFSIVGKETLQLQLGELQTLHVRRSTTDSDEGLDVWLAIDRHYLPVRILRIDRKDSRPVELVASELLVTEEDNKPQ